MYSQGSLKEGGRTFRVTGNVTTISKSDLISQYFTICFSCHKFINKTHWVRYAHSFLNDFSHHEVLHVNCFHTVYASFSQWPKHLKDEGGLHDLIRVQLNKGSAKTLIWTSMSMLLSDPVPSTMSLHPFYSLQHEPSHRYFTVLSGIPQMSSFSPFSCNILKKLHF